MKLLLFFLMIFCSLEALAQEYINICDRGNMGRIIAKKLDASCKSVPVDQMARLTDLDIDNFLPILNYEKISSHTLEGLTGLKKIRLDNVAILEGVPFKDLVALESIDFSSCFSKESVVDKDLFRDLNSLVEIQNFGGYGFDVKQIPVEIFSNLNSLESLSLYLSADDTLDILDVLDLIPKNIKNLEIRITSNEPKELIIPDGAFKDFKSMKSLTIMTWYKISVRISDDALKGLSSLESFVIQAKDININAKSFGYMKALKTLKGNFVTNMNELPQFAPYLRELSIISSTISPESLEKLTDLNSLELKTDVFPSEHLSKVKNIKKLRLEAPLNTSINIPSNAFVMLPDLEDLTIHLPSTIAPDAFSGLSQLKSLHIWSTDRKLTINENWFDNLFSLSKLFLYFHREARHPTLSKEVFKSLKNLESLELYIGTSRYFQLVDTFDNLTSLKRLRFSHEYVSEGYHYGPKNPIVERMLKNLVLLEELSLSGYYEYSESSFSHLTNLKSIRIEGSVSGTIFNGLANLKRINISGGVFKEKDSKIFEGLPSVEDISVDSIYVKDGWEKDPQEGLVLFDLVDSLTSLKKLGVLLSNEKTVIRPNTFTPLKNLERLELRRPLDPYRIYRNEVGLKDNVVVIGENISDTADEQPVLIDICAQGKIGQIIAKQTGSNDCSKVRKELFEKIKDLEISNEQIDVLQKESFQGMNLRSITITNSKIQKIIPGAFKELTSLEGLNLSKNSISLIEPDTFQGLVNLKKLNLSENVITTVETNTFPNLDSLETIDLSLNRISVIKRNAFLGLLGLNTLRLKMNPIPKISRREVGLYGHVDVEGGVEVTP